MYRFNYHTYKQKHALYHAEYSIVFVSMHYQIRLIFSYKLIEMTGLTIIGDKLVDPFSTGCSDLPANSQILTFAKNTPHEISMGIK